MTNLIGLALRRRPLLPFLLLAALNAPLWRGGTADRPSADEERVSAPASDEAASACRETHSALVLLPRAVPRGPAARGLEGAEHLARSCEVLRHRTGQLLQVAASGGDSTRVRAVEILRIGFARAVAFASTGTDSAQTAALPPPFFA